MSVGFAPFGAARRATNDSARAQFEDLARQWEQIASDLENLRQQADELGLKPDLLSKSIRPFSDGLNA